MKTKSPLENNRWVSTFRAWVAPAVAIMSSLAGGEGRGGEGRGGEGRGGEGEGRGGGREGSRRSYHSSYYT